MDTIYYTLSMHQICAKTGLFSLVRKEFVATTAQVLDP